MISSVPSNVQPKDMIESIREFIRHFFLCEECTQHFLNMTSNAANEIHSYQDNVLYLWRGNQSKGNEFFCLFIVHFFP